MTTVHKPVDEAEIATYNEILVDGEWLKSSGNEMIEVINPATEQPIARVVRGTAHDVDLAARAAAAGVSSLVSHLHRRAGRRPEPARRLDREPRRRDHAADHQ